MLSARPAGRRLRAGGRADRGRQDPRGPARTSRCRATQPRWSTPRTGSSSPASSTPTAIPIRASCAASSPAALLNPDYNRDIQSNADAGLSGRGRLCRDAGDGARHDRHGHDRDRRHLAGQRTRRSTATPAFARCRSPASGRSTPIHRGAGPARNIRRTSSGCSGPTSAHKDQLLTLALSRKPRRAMSSRWRARSACRSSSISSATTSSPQLLALGRAGLLRPGDEYIHCTRHQRRGVAADQGHRRPRFALRRRSTWRWATALPAIQEALDHGLRPSAELRPRRDRSRRISSR